MLHMTYKYAPLKGDEDKTEAFNRAVIANAKRGGENVATGALMGALLGGHCGYSKLPKHLLEGLSRGDRTKLDEEVESFIESLPLFASL